VIFLAELLNSTTAGAPYGIAVSDNYIYWTDIIDDAIYRIPLATPTQRMRREVGPSDIFLVMNNTDATGALTVVNKESLNICECNTQPGLYITGGHVSVVQTAKYC